MITPVTRSNKKDTTLLDAVAAQLGRDGMREAFYSLYKLDSAAALRVLDDDRLGFPALYALRPEIIKLGLESSLSARNSAALKILKLLASRDYTAYESDTQHKDVLKWIFNTGRKETNLGEEYDGIIDAAAALLVKVYNDKDCLPGLCDMIFDRHRSGLNIYDAEWAFFESGDAQCISLVSKRLASPDVRDVMLAQNLLRFLPCFDPGQQGSKQYSGVIRWIRENGPYLFYTGESSLMRGEPCRFTLSLESKYLQRPQPQSDMPPLPGERERLNEFGSLDERTKARLSDYSQRLHAGDIKSWNRWIGAPITAQIESMQNPIRKGGRHGNN